MARSRRDGPRLAIYGRTYLDAEVEVPIDSLATGKGKQDVRVAAGAGGFALNAARAIADRFSAGAVSVVTVSAWLDWPRLRQSLPDGVTLDAILAGPIDAPWPPVSVIVNPSAACRLLRDRVDDDAALWRADRVASGALAARLHVLGRLPAEFALDVLRRCRAADARFAWCGGYSLPLELERECDFLLVNSAEARRLLGVAEGSGTPRELAIVLAGRATREGAVRIVTGGGGAATTAAIRAGKTIRGHEARPAAVAPEKITTLKGVGDAFAATFLAAACFDDRGAPRRRPDVEGGLAAAQRAAGRFITRKL